MLMSCVHYGLNIREMNLRNSSSVFLVKFRRNVAGAGRWQLVDVNEETSLSITRIKREHTVVDVLLNAGAAVARCQGTAR